jgi:acyl-coenzyme A thioesterase PaaI-like protein/3-methyladenine DNA glycosylase AlkD
LTSEATARTSPLADFTFEPHTCFACGELNEHGLHLELHASSAGCWTEIELDPRFQGWDSVAHGGIVTTLLDEVMAWSVIGRGTWGVTARLAISFRKPVPVGSRIRAEGWVIEDRRRTFRTAGRVLDPATGTVLAEGTGTFVAPPPDQLAALKRRYRLRRSSDGVLERDPDRDPDREPGQLDITDAVAGSRDRRAAKSSGSRSGRADMTAPAPTVVTAPITGSIKSARAAAFVADMLPRATGLGRAVAEEVGDPSALAASLSAAFDLLADPLYRAEQARVAPGLGRAHGVRQPLLQALHRSFDKGTRRDSSSTLLLVADRLLREPTMEPRWFAVGLLDRTLRVEPERTWQLLRRAAREAGDWITIDTVAQPVARGILREPYRWAELEQLVISPSRWERRLVGSTIASMPFVDRRAGRAPEVAARSLAILATLIGDTEPDVQKALAWAYRSMASVDLGATTAALDAEARIAARSHDGLRARVIRDAAPKLALADASRLRTMIEGLRRRPGVEPTSRAAELAHRFEGMGLGRQLPEPPL